MRMLKECQELLLLSVLAVAQRRLSEEEVEKLEGLAQRMARHPKEALELEKHYWRIVTRAAQNPVLERLLLWCGSTDGSQDTSGATPVLFSEANYTAMNIALRNGIGMVDVIRTGVFLALRGSDEVSSQ
jgi:DNA-binding FadR family transcriptional regulator